MRYSISVDCLKPAPLSMDVSRNVLQWQQLSRMCSIHSYSRLHVSCFGMWFQELCSMLFCCKRASTRGHFLLLNFCYFSRGSKAAKISKGKLPTAPNSLNSTLSENPQFSESGVSEILFYFCRRNKTKPKNYVQYIFMSIILKWLTASSGSSARLPVFFSEPVNRHSFCIAWVHFICLGKRLWSEAIIHELCFN